MNAAAAGMAKQGRAQLEEMWARERAENAAARARAGWQSPGAQSPGRLNEAE